MKHDTWSARAATLPGQGKILPKGERKSGKWLIIAKEEEFLYPVSDPRCHLWFFEDGLPGYAWYVPKSGGYLNVGIGGAVAGLKKRGTSLDQHWQRLIHKLAELNLVRNHDFHPLGYSYYLRQRNLTPARIYPADRRFAGGWPPVTWVRVSYPPSRAAFWRLIRLPQGALIPSNPSPGSHFPLSCASESNLAILCLPRGEGGTACRMRGKTNSTSIDNSRIKKYTIPQYSIWRYFY